VSPGADPEGPNRAATTPAQTADRHAVIQPDAAAWAKGSRFIRACLRQPVDRTPVWFLRQAGRYMPEYRAVRAKHSLLEICRTPSLAAEVTITAAEYLGVDAAIIFADLLLPLTPMGLDFEFVADEGPRVHSPIRTLDQVRALRTDRTADLNYVARAIELVTAHFNTRVPQNLGAPCASLSGTWEGSMDALGIIGFCGAPFTLASYMIEGGSSRNYIETKKLMYASAQLRSEATESGLTTNDCHPERSEGPPHLSFDRTARNPEGQTWPLLMEKLVTVLADFAAQQVEAGADVIQVFDSWAGALSPSDYRDYVLPPTTDLIHRIQALGVPVIYFGVDTATLLPLMRRTGADVLGLDWRTPLDHAWRSLDYSVAVQGNLDPITLFAPEAVLHARVQEILAAANGRPGHIFNLGHGIVPHTPVDAVLSVVRQIKNSAR
jgi:uroporphyrinogen decarboxylase